MFDIDIFDIANGISLIGTCLGLFSRVPQVYRTYKTKSANDLSTQTMSINISPKDSDSIAFFKFT